MAWRTSMMPWALAAVTLALALFGWRVAAQPAGTVADQVIQVVAKKFTYVPNEIRLKKGVPVVLEFTSADAVMGFKAVDFNASAVIIPGKVARVRITPTHAGTFIFFCHIFCGDGHETMNGTIVVED